MFKFLFREFLVTVQPLEGWHDYLESAFCALPLSSDFSTALLIGSCETNLLDGRVVETLTTDYDVGTARLGSEVRLNLLNMHIVVAEVHWLTSELLPVQSHINRIHHILSIMVLQVGDRRNNFTILVKAFGTSPLLLMLMESGAGSSIFIQ